MLACSTAGAGLQRRLLPGAAQPDGRLRGRRLHLRRQLQGKNLESRADILLKCASIIKIVRSDAPQLDILNVEAQESQGWGRKLIYFCAMQGDVYVHDAGTGERICHVAPVKVQMRLPSLYPYSFW